MYSLYSGAFNVCRQADGRSEASAFVRIPICIDFRIGEWRGGGEKRAAGFRVSNTRQDNVHLYNLKNICSC